MSLNLGSILALLVGFQLVFVAVYLITHKRGNKRNNRLLAFLLLMFAINLLDFALRIAGITFSIPLVHLLDDCFFLLFGPILYFYTEALVYRDFTFGKKNIWHFVPYLLATTAVIFMIVFIPRASQEEVADRMVSAELPKWVFVITMFVYVHILVYLWMSWQTIERYRSILMDNFSDIDEINLDWLRFMIRTFAIITIVAMVNSIIPIFGNVYILYFSAALLLIASFYFINLVLVKALNQPAIFSGIEKEEKYAQSTLQSNELDSYKEQLGRIMESDQPYLSSDLKSKYLAEQLGISTKLLSQVINQGFGMNFFDYVNSYRCEEVKRILNGADKKITILEAMYQAGFNSKSSFNKEFKKLTGQTPGEYKKSIGS